jgi:NAD(P)-dependent dehydrogenase (short-subunit alcohol dehydrogenase family)
MGKLDGKIAIVLGAGQTPGETVGNGRATAVLFAREGATVICCDLYADRAEDTVAEIRAEGGQADAYEIDVTDEQQLIDLFAHVVAHYGRIDVLHNNVGVSIAAGDKPVDQITEDVFTAMTRINLTSMVLACKHVLPIMRRQQSGSIIHIASNAVLIDYPNITYQTSKVGVVSLTTNVAIANAEYGIRCNVILPGLMDTPIAIEARAALGVPRDEVRAQRNAKVPLGGRMGTGWDIGRAAVFLASDDAGFITGVSLPVDGGQSLRCG